MKSDRINYRHAEERSYSAKSYDHVFQLILDDPQGIIKKAIKSNSLTKWHRQEHQEEIKAEFVAMLHKRYMDKRDDLVELFNGSFFNYFLVRFLRNQLMSSTSPFADTWQRFSGIEVQDYHASTDPAVHLDDPRSLNPTDRDVIFWLLGTKNLLAAFRREDLALYRRYLTHITNNLQHITIKQWCLDEKLDYKPTVKLFAAITQMMRQQVKHLNSL